LQKFKKATELDKTFVRAYIGLADCYTSMGGLTMSPQEAKVEALKAIESADELLKATPTVDLPELHAARGLIYYWLVRNWKEADDEFNKAINLDGKLYATRARYGAFLVAENKPFDALAQIIQAQAINPYSWPLNTSLGQFYYFTGDMPSAIKQYQSILAQAPDFDAARRFLALALEQNGDHAGAITNFKLIPETSYEYPDALGGLGHVYAVNKETDKAREVLKRLDELKSSGRYVSTYSIAVIHLGLGDTAQAFKLFNQAVEENDVRLAWLNVDPRLQNLRETKSKHELDEFAKLLRAANLSQPN
jgi:tetratricopeptide (TPR) repeat protein